MELFHKIPVSENGSRQSVRCVGISNPYLQTSFQETVFKACFLLSNYHPKKPFPRPVFQCIQTSFQDTIIIPRNRFQGLFFHMSLIHISKPSIIPKHPFDGVPRGSVRSFRHSVPSFRHSLTSPLFTFRQSKNCLHSNKQYSPKHGSVK